MVKATTKRAAPTASRQAETGSTARIVSEPDAQLEKRRRRFGSDGFGGGSGERPLAGDATWQAATEAEEARQAALDEQAPPTDDMPGLLDAEQNHDEAEYWEPHYVAPPPIEEVPPPPPAA